VSIYLSGSKPRILAHRGFTRAPDGSALDENTIDAFQAALDAGADFLESDIQVTRDGVPVLFHDDDLSRVAGYTAKVSELTSRELSDIRLQHGAQIPTLRETLDHFPTARFNLDFKTSRAIGPGSAAIISAGAESRVLVASFSESNRKAAQSKLVGSVGSAGMSRFLGIYLCSVFRLRRLQGLLSANLVALQIPLSAGPLRFDTRRFVSSVHSSGLEVHYWTVNDPTEMKRLISLGADGLVTDDCATARSLFPY
jgi:glycerophosphoryl diester phosphodiesterase